MKKVFLLLSMLLFLTGCGKTTDIEDRNYALVMGIDKAEAGIRVTYSFADLSKIEGGTGKSRESKTLSLEGRNLDAVEQEYKTFQDKKLELGHLKAFIFGNKLTQDTELFSCVLSDIQDNTEYANTIMVFTSDKDARDIVNLDSKIKGLLGDYLNDMYENNLGEAGTDPVTMGRFLRSKDENEAIRVLRLTEKKERPSVVGDDLFTMGNYKVTCIN